MHNIYKIQILIIYEYLTLLHLTNLFIYSLSLKFLSHSHIMEFKINNY
jgi:hypothetical protein